MIGDISPEQLHLTMCRIFKELNIRDTPKARELFYWSVYWGQAWENDPQTANRFK